MKKHIHNISEMSSYLLLWFTQFVSGLGSAMTAYALVIWSYTQAGSALRTDGLLTRLFGVGKGSGAAFLFAVLWLMGIAVCMIFRADKHIWKLEE